MTLPELVDALAEARAVLLAVDWSSEARRVIAERKP